MKVFCAILFIIVASAETPQAQQTDSFDKLAADFWSWRARYAPFTGDDVNRIERPGGVRDWSRAKLDNQRKELNEFEARWRKIDSRAWPIARQVDYRLVGSALSRVRWELDINPGWRRDPTFYIGQTLTPIVEALTVPGPYNEAQSREILTRINNVPSILEQARQNLEKPAAPFARVAVQSLENIRPHLHQMASALAKSTTLKEQDFYAATDRAADALEKYRGYLQQLLPSLPNETALGRDAYIFFLRALQGFGETDDFTLPSRLNQDCIRYVTEPSTRLGYFWRATAQDPRPICVHEGIPGHYFQLCLSWKQENPIRRHYYASTANEGIAFYAEEMMLQAGLFDDSPHTREIIYNFMRLRALRVEVDVRLALGQATLDQAAKYLHDKVPMDMETARAEATAFATGPGGAISYQIGKLQIVKFLADARLQQGDRFNLRAFHDFVWKNGNVPISLQRWEYLGDASEVPE